MRVYSWNGSFWEVFGPLLPQIWSSIAEILTRGNTLGNKNIVWKNLKDSNFHQKETDPKFAFLVQLWLPIFPWRWPKSKKIISGEEKRQPLGYPNMSKSSLYLLSPGKTRLLFVIFGLDFQVWLLFLVPRLYFWKEWLSFTVAEFNAESIDTNFKSQK